MAVDRIIVNALVAEYTGNTAGLTTLRGTILAAYISRNSVNIHISSASGDFGSSTGIELATQDQQRDMLENIAAALIQLAGTAPDVSTRAAVMDFSSRRTEL